MNPRNGSAANPTPHRLEQRGPLGLSTAGDRNMNADLRCRNWCGLRIYRHQQPKRNAWGGRIVSVATRNLDLKYRYACFKRRSNPIWCGPRSMNQSLIPHVAVPFTMTI